jgi:hypothetical protein
MVDITKLKQQARALEQQGDLAAALGAYREVLRQFELAPNVEPDVPLYVKVGDLSLKTGDQTVALDMFERAAERYADLGSAKSVIALCLKIIRTDPRRTDVYLRYARRLLAKGHVESTRLVLLDCAQRAKLQKTLNTLQELGERPESERRGLLEQFFAAVTHGTGTHVALGGPLDPSTADAAPPKPEQAERPAATTRATPAAVPEQTKPQPSVSDRKPRPSRPTPVEEPPVPAAADPVVAEIRSRPFPTKAVATPSAATPPVEVPPATVPKPQPTVPRTPMRRTEPPQRRPWRLATFRRELRARPAWLWPAMSAAAVVVVGVGLLGFGAMSSGAELGAAPPELPIPLASMRAAGDSLADSSSSPADNAAETGAVVAVPESKPEPVKRTRIASSRSVVPSELDPSALAAAQEAALAVRSDSVDVELSDDLTSVGATLTMPAVPLTSAATSGRLGAGMRAAPSRRGAASEGPVIVIDGLEVEAVARFSGPAGASHQVVQRLENGGRITLHVSPFAGAPRGETGRLRVETDSGATVGTVRFEGFFVTARADLSPAVLEGLLRRLTRQGGN